MNTKSTIFTSFDSGISKCDKLPVFTETKKSTKDLYSEIKSSLEVPNSMKDTVSTIDLILARKEAFNSHDGG